MLEAQDEEQQDKARRVEGDERERVARPVLPLVGPDAGGPQEGPLDWREERHLAGEDPCHVEAERDGDGDEEGRKERGLRQIG